MNIQAAKQEVVQAGIRLVNSGLIARTWGNVSARVSPTSFVITPSGRDYLTLTPEEIVEVQISDLSWEGAVKPSGEKAVHAAIYANRANVDFIVHTHQTNASAISATSLERISVKPSYSLLGGEVVLADYALPNTKKLQKNVAAALGRSKGHAIIMKKHGAVCFGVDADQVFEAATQLEAACADLVSNEFSSRTDTRVEGYCDSERIRGGFILRYRGEVRRIPFGGVGPGLPREASLHQTIYLEHPGIRAIVHAHSPATVAVSQQYPKVYPVLDDFAQIVGTRMKAASGPARLISKELKRASAVFLPGKGALCCGATVADAEAVRMIVEKNCLAYMWGENLGGVKPINRVEAALMNLVYKLKYSKQISQ